MFEQTLHNLRSFNPNKKPLMIACSAGVDSVVLAYIASKLKNEMKIVLGHVAHHIRSKKETELDYAVVYSLSQVLGLDFICTDLVVSREGNLEENARKARYAALAQMSKNCVVVATAHHADDNFISILMNICRGCGPNGLMGIRSEATIENCRVVRPMLHATKSEILCLAKERNLGWREDHTNMDFDLVRNSLRELVLPVLKTHFPRCSEHSVKMRSYLEGSK